MLLTISLEFVDSAGEVLLSPENSFVIDSPDVESDGRVLNPSITTSQLSLNDSEIASLLSSSKIVTTVRVSTFNAEEGESVKIFSDYELKMEIGILAEVVVEL